MIAQFLRATLLAGVTLATAPAAHAASGTASFLVVHGIPGRDVAPTLDPALPVDVQVNGALCLLKNLTFGDIAGPFDVPAGTYSVAISLANPIAPCSNSPVISANVTLTAGEFGAIVAQLSSAGAPTAGVYPVDVTSVGAGKQRFITVHAADAPAVSVRVVSLGKSPENAKFILQPGTVNDSSVPTRDRFAATVQAPGGATFGPYVVSGGDQSLFFLAAVGNASTGSVTVLSKLLRSVE